MNAGLDQQLQAQIAFEGSTMEFVASLLSVAADYGTLADGREPIPAFLDALKDTVGEDGRASIDSFLSRFGQTTGGRRSHEVTTYLRYLRDKWETLDSPLLPSGLSLSRIALSARLRDTGAKSGESEFKMSGYPPVKPGSSHRPSAELAEFLRVGGRYLVLADPGMGKSTLLLREAARLAQAAGTDADAPIPIWVGLSSFARHIRQLPAASLWDYVQAIGQSLGVTHLTSRVRKLAEAGRSVLLFDGLDEIPSEERETVMSRVTAAIEGSNAVVFTSRKVGFAGPSALSVLELEALTVDEQRELMLRICGPEKTALLLRMLGRRGDLADLAAIPMTLTVLCLVARESLDYEGEDDLPSQLRRRSDLYSTAVRLLLEGRHRGRQGVLNPEKAEQILARTSFHLHKATEPRSGEDFPATEVIRAVEHAERDWLRPWQGPRDFLSDVARRSSLLYPADTLERNYRYLHRTFREFLAALELSRLDSERRRAFVEQHLEDSTWSEVLTLLGGLTSDIDEYVSRLIEGPPDLALRALSEIDHLGPDLAAKVLELPSRTQRDRRELFRQIGRKLASPRDARQILSDYVGSVGSRILRCDLYFVEELARKFDPALADELMVEMLRRLPPVPEGLVDAIETDGTALPYWCEVTGGPFDIGASADDPAKLPWIPERKRISVSAFQIGRVPVTNAIYEVFDPSHRLDREFQDEVPILELDQHPVVRVSWYDAHGFCQWLAQFLPDVCLPSEAQWEKAASWTSEGKKRRFPWGDGWDPLRLNSWHKGPNRTTPVGAYPSGAAPCGAVDMAGNVWEWCADWFDDDLTATAQRLETSPSDPTGPIAGTRRIDKGGGWYHDVGMPCTFLRAADDPADVFSHCGFRLARSSSTTSEPRRT